MAIEDYKHIVLYHGEIDLDAVTEFAFWDKIDLTSYIEKYHSLEDLRDALSEKFGKQLLDETGAECVFNSIDSGDFASYLNNKYNAGFKGVIRWER